MSRIGKQSIIIPDGVRVIKDGDVIRVSGPKGNVERSFRDVISFEISDNVISLRPATNTVEARRLWGTYAAHVRNMLKGAKDGFEKHLEIEGVGYRVSMKGDNLILHVGFSHPIEVPPKPGIHFQVEKNTITVSGVDKEKVGEMAAFIRSIRKPEPYKGKGIRYKGEFIRRKAGKKAATASA